MSQEIKTISNIAELSHDELNVVTGGYDPNQYTWLERKDDGSAVVHNPTNDQQVQSIDATNRKLFGKPATAACH